VSAQPHPVPGQLDQRSRGCAHPDAKHATEVHQ